MVPVQEVGERQHHSFGVGIELVDNGVHFRVEILPTLRGSEGFFAGYSMI